MSEAREDSSPARIYQAKLNQGIFEIQRCGDCDLYVHYPRSICPHCGSLNLAWSKPSGRGVVYSTTTVRTSPDLAEHYNVTLIDLEEGVRLMSRIEGIANEDVCIGMLVSAMVRTVDGIGLLAFRQRDRAR